MTAEKAAGINIQHLGLVDYQTACDRMRTFTATRTADTVDEIWLLEHHPVYTLGRGARDGHLHHIGDEIPVVKSDRGGQVTYHGPGQLIAYILVDLKRSGYGVRSLVNRIEQGLINYLAGKSLPAARRQGAPGVYVHNAKIAALGLRVKNGCSYHGLSLNVDMDLTPFNRIDPCGFPGLAVTQLKDLGAMQAVEDVARELVICLTEQLQCEAIPKTTSQFTTMEDVAHD